MIRPGAVLRVLLDLDHRDEITSRGAVADLGVVGQGSVDHDIVREAVLLGLQEVMQRATVLAVGRRPEMAQALHQAADVVRLLASAAALRPLAEFAEGRCGIELITPPVEQVLGSGLRLV